MTASPEHVHIVHVLRLVIVCIKLSVHLQGVKQKVLYTYMEPCSKVAVLYLAQYS